MKNLIMSLSAMMVVIALSMTGCKKDNSSSAINPAINNDLNSAKTAELRSLAYNDTLVMYYDTASIRKANPNLIHFDRLYHQNDSLFIVMYKMFGGEMYNYGMIMSGFTTGGAMGGGMMGGGTTSAGLTNAGMMNIQLLRTDSTMMNGYYNNMTQLRINHQAYHNAIYN